MGADAWPSQVDPGVGTGTLTCFSGPFGDAGGLFEKEGHGGLTDLQVVGPVGLWRHEWTRRMRGTQT